MSLRIKLFLLPTLAIAVAAALVALGSVRYARRQSEQATQQRTQTLVTQFQREMTERGEEVSRAVQGVADSEATLRMALDLTRTQADPSIYANDARGLAKTYHLDFLELTTADGTLISSNQWAPASGYHNDWVAGDTDWSHQGAFLSRVQLPDKVDMGLLAVRAVKVNDRNLYVIGGWRFDRAFLRSLAVPEGMSALLYANIEPQFVAAALSGPEGPIAEADDFAPLIESVQRGENLPPQAISSPDQGGAAQIFIAVPLQGRGGERLGALLVGNSQENPAALVSYVRSLALMAAGFGVLFSLGLSWWVSAGVRRRSAQTIAQEPRARAETVSVAAPHDLSGQLSRERERLVQVERVATRREMARRFARDIKESIFPLHMAAEDMLDARGDSERFDEIFLECSTSMRAELENLKHAAARFGEFGRAARPRPVPVSVNEMARAALKAVEPQFHAAGRPPVIPEVHLGEPDPVIEADPDQLRAALENLLLHCVDAMTAGGTLAVRTREKNSTVYIEVSAQGASLSPEDTQRLFVPAGATPEGMTGLGLASADAFVSDHGGRISAESVPGAGTTLRLEFAAAPAGRVRPVQNEPARATQRETAQQAQPETTTTQRMQAAPVRQGAAEITQPIPAAGARPVDLPVAALPAEPEPVPVAVVALEATTSSEETPTVPEAPQVKQTSDFARTRRGLLFTE